MAVSKRKAKQIAKRYWPLGIVGLAVVVVALAWLALPAAEWIEALSPVVASLGAFGPVIYVCLYIFGALILAPSPLIAIAAGAIFGWWGLPLAVLGGTAGATASFLLSRYFFGETLDEWVEDRRAFRAVKSAVDADDWKIILPLRLSPVVPFGLLNYMLGLTRISLTSYIVCTAIGIFPGTLIDVYIGVIGVTAATVANSTQLAFLALGLAATLVVAVFITVKARAYLRKEGVKV